MRRHIEMIVLLAVFSAVTVTVGVLNPIGEAPDEAAHMDLVRFISQTGQLPRTDADRERAGYKSDTPMLYHLVVGMALGWIDYSPLPAIKESSTDPRCLLITDGLSPWAVIHTEDETWPWRGIVLAWHLARLVSTLMSILTLLVIYRAVMLMLPAALNDRSRRWLAVGAAALLAFNPQFTFISAAVNDDTLLGLLMALFSWCLLAAWRHPDRLALYAGAGICLGLALTTKYSVALLPLAVVAFLMLQVRRSRVGCAAAPGRLAVFGTAVGVAASWWFIFVTWNFNRVSELGPVRGLVQAFLGGSRADSSMQQVVALVSGGAVAGVGSARSWADWIVTLFVSFWLPGSPLDRRSGILMCVIVAVLALLAVVGLVRGSRRIEAFQGDGRTHLETAALPLSMLAWLILYVFLLLPFPAVRYYLTGNVAESAQGRHILFPAGVPIALLLAAGVAAWLPAQRRPTLSLVAAGVLLTVNVANFFGLMLPAYPDLLPVRTGAAPAVATPANVTFGDSIELVGFEVGDWNVHGALPVTLAWRSLGYSAVDYLIDLSLVDSGGEVRARWVGHPVDGRYPTRAWEKGEFIRDDVWLVAPGLAAGEYALCLRLVPADAAGRSTLAADGCTSLTRVSLSAAPAAAHLSDYTVWQSGAPASDSPVYRYRATIQVSRNAAASEAVEVEGTDDLHLIGPDEVERTALARVDDTFSFLVEAHWPSGRYRLRTRVGGRMVDGPPILEVRLRPRRFDVPPMARRVDANLGGEIVLLGYDFPERRVRAGGALPITLHWQALRDVQSHYVVFNHLLDSSLRQWGGRDRIPRDYYSTALWAAGEVVSDDYTVPVDPAAPDGIYRLDVGLYQPLNGDMGPLWLIDDGRKLDANSVLIASVKVGGPPPGVTVLEPSPGHARADRLGDLVTLIGYDLETERDQLTLTLYWRCEAAMAVDYTTFVHVTTAGGDRIVGQKDGPPAGGAYPTSLWDVGEVIRDAVTVLLPEDLPGGDYEIRVGLYDAARGLRLPVGSEPGGSVVLTTVHRGARP